MWVEVRGSRLKPAADTLIIHSDNSTCKLVASSPRELCSCLGRDFFSYFEGLLSPPGAAGSCAGSLPLRELLWLILRDVCALLVTRYFKHRSYFTTPGYDQPIQFTQATGAI